MKLNRLITLTLLLACLSLQAQTEPQPSAKALTEKMKTDVGFREELTPQVEAINATFVTKVKEARKTEDQKEKFALLRVANQERNKSLKAIFSPKEFMKFQQAQKQNVDKVREKAKTAKTVAE